MWRLCFIFIIIIFSSCGEDTFLEDFDEIITIDSIYVDSFNLNNIISDSFPIIERPEIEYTELFQLSSESKNSSQGFAIFNKYLFNCHHSNDVIDVFDLEKQKMITSIELEPDLIVHCNIVYFGNEFYSKDDKFPLLYVQQRGYACKMNAYRIICLGDSIVAAEKVQTISFESCSSCINAIDCERNFLYAIYGFKGKNYISNFKMPTLNGGNITIHPRSSYNTYYSPFTKVCQDTAFDDKFLYLLCGYSKEGELWRIDLENKEAKVVDFTKYGLIEEPEGVDIYKDGILVSFINSSFYFIKIHDK